MSLCDLEIAVHVWYCHPDEITDQVKLDSYRSILSGEELDKHRRFHFAKDRHSYLVSHALLRKVLSMYADVAPEQWSFITNHHGRPEINPEIDCPQLKFNLSHTDGLSACAVTLHVDCGVDVENIQRQNKLLPIAQRMFAAPELETMHAGSTDEMREKFFAYWTLREAYVKALGTGLAGSSKAFYFQLAQNLAGEKTAEICFIDAAEKSAYHWQFSLLNPSSEHALAVAIRLAEPVQKTVVYQQILP